MSIRELRRARGLTQKMLAHELGVTEITVKFWETGMRLPSRSHAQQLAQFFGVPLSYFPLRTRTEPLCPHCGTPLLGKYAGLVAPPKSA